MSYYDRTEPPDLSIGSDYVTLTSPRSSQPPIVARILRREDGPDGEPVLLVLDRRVGTHGMDNLIAVEHVSTTDKRTWFGRGCFATELSRERKQVESEPEPDEDGTDYTDDPEEEPESDDDATNDPD